MLVIFLVMLAGSYLSINNAIAQINPLTPKGADALGKVAADLLYEDFSPAGQVSNKGPAQKSYLKVGYMHLILSTGRAILGENKKISENTRELKKLFSAVFMQGNDTVIDAFFKQAKLQGGGANKLTPRVQKDFFRLLGDEVGKCRKILKFARRSDATLKEVVKYIQVLPLWEGAGCGFGDYVAAKAGIKTCDTEPEYDCKVPVAKQYLYVYYFFMRNPAIWDNAEVSLIKIQKRCEQESR